MTEFFYDTVFKLNHGGFHYLLLHYGHLNGAFLLLDYGRNKYNKQIYVQDNLVLSTGLIM